MKQTTIIIPIHEFNADIKQYLDKCIESIEEQKKSSTPDVIVVCPADIDGIEEYLLNKTSLKINIVYNNGNSSFQSQINLAVKSVKTEYFSILELDDTLSDVYIHLVETYLNNDEFIDVDVMLPFIIETDVNGLPIKMTNDPIWSKQFVGENGTVGYLNIDVLKQYTDFKICGGIFNKDKFIQVGGLKSNIELTFQLELLMRLINAGTSVYVLPKIIYKHIVGRDGSLFSEYGKTTTLADRNFWFEKAMSEFYFTEDRVIEREVKLNKIESNVQ